MCSPLPPLEETQFRPTLCSACFSFSMTRRPVPSFAVVRFNERTYQSGGVVAVIKGVEAARRTLHDFGLYESEEGRLAGWRYFLEKTNLRPGMDPEKATKLRQERLDLVES